MALESIGPGAGPAPPSTVPTLPWRDSTDSLEIVGIIWTPQRTGALPQAEQGMLEDRQFVVAGEGVEHAVGEIPGSDGAADQSQRRTMTGLICSVARRVVSGRGER